MFKCQNGINYFEKVEWIQLFESNAFNIKTGNDVLFNSHELYELLRRIYLRNVKNKTDHLHFVVLCK